MAKSIEQIQLAIARKAFRKIKDLDCSYGLSPRGECVEIADEAIETMRRVKRIVNGHKNKKRASYF